MAALSQKPFDRVETETPTARQGVGRINEEGPPAINRDGADHSVGFQPRPSSREVKNKVQAQMTSQTRPEARGRAGTVPMGTGRRSRDEECDRRCTGLYIEDARRPRLRFERGLCPRKLRGRFGRGACPPPSATKCGEVRCGCTQ